MKSTQQFLTIGIRSISLLGFIVGGVYWLHTFLENAEAWKQGSKVPFHYIAGIDNPDLLIQPSIVPIVSLLVFVFSRQLAALICRGTE